MWWPNPATWASPGTCYKCRLSGPTCWIYIVPRSPENSYAHESLKNTDPEVCESITTARIVSIFPYSSFFFMKLNVVVFLIEMEGGKDILLWPKLPHFLPKAGPKVSCQSFRFVSKIKVMGKKERVQKEENCEYTEFYPWKIENNLNYIYSICPQCSNG